MSRLSFAMGLLAIAAGCIAILLRRRLATRAVRGLRRRYGALGDEASKQVSSTWYAVGGGSFIVLGCFWCISTLVGAAHQ